MTINPTINALPQDAIPCNGPLMYDLNRYVTPDGKLFSFRVSTNKISEIQINVQNNFAWSSAKQLNEDGTSTNMPRITGFYSKDNVNAKALIAYYFVKKIDPTDMRADLKDITKPLHKDNLEWVTRTEQSNRVLAISRKSVNTKNTYKNIDGIDINNYTEWKDKYFVKNDGTEVIRITNNAKYRNVPVTIGNNGYKTVSFIFNKKTKTYRMDRLMMAIHSGLDLEDISLTIKHLDNDILNNKLENLKIISIQENINSDSCEELLKVDPETNTIVETIKSIFEYVSKHSEYKLKTLRRVKNNGELYNDFIWLDKSLEGKLFELKNNVVTMLEDPLDEIVDTIRSKIHTMFKANEITKEMLPINENNNIEHTERVINIVNNLDPRGLGNIESFDILQNRISNHLPCCRVISMHGNIANTQLVICLKTLLIFKRSGDNLSLDNRKCPLCIFDRDGSRKKFMSDDPEMSIPIYSFTTACGKGAKKNPLSFQGEYLTIVKGVTSVNTFTHMQLKSIRECLFGVILEPSDNWIKNANGHPKRATFGYLNWSFYPPKDNHLCETDPDWLLQRRLNCATMQHLKTTVLKRRNKLDNSN